MELYQEKEFFKKVIEKFGKHYYYASLFFPKNLRNKIFIIYAFLRRLDDIVDDYNLSFKDKKQNFLNWFYEFKKVRKNEKSEIFLELNYFNEFLKEKNVNKKFVKAFIKSMYFDLNPVRINNYKKLRKYMFGSATVVGYFVLYALDSFNKKTINYARALAEAMQLTNFLRDLKEDLTLNRIYLPLKVAKKFNLTEKDFFNHNFNENFRKFIKYNVLITQKLYNKALKGIKYLPFYSQFPIFYSLNLYRSILFKIIKNDYNVFDFNYRLTFFDKFFIFIKSLIQFIFYKLFIWKIKK